MSMLQLSAWHWMVWPDTRAGLQMKTGWAWTIDYCPGDAGIQNSNSMSLPDTEWYDPAPAPRMGLRRLASTQVFVPVQISIPMSRTDTGRYDSAPAPVFNPRTCWSWVSPGLAGIRYSSSNSLPETGYCDPAPAPRLGTYWPPAPAIWWWSIRDLKIRQRQLAWTPFSRLFSN